MTTEQRRARKEAERIYYEAGQPNSQVTIDHDNGDQLCYTRHFDVTGSESYIINRQEGTIERV